MKSYRETGEVFAIFLASGKQDICEQSLSPIAFLAKSYVALYSKDSFRSFFSLGAFPKLFLSWFSVRHA